MKKVLSMIIVFAYLNCYLGCTSKLVITDKEVDTGTNNVDLIVMTKDSTIYTFEANMYRFKSDSLDGIAEINGEEKKHRVKIALMDIVKTGDLIKDSNLGVDKTQEKTIVGNESATSSVGLSWSVIGGVNLSSISNSYYSPSANFFILLQKSFILSENIFLSTGIEFTILKGTIGTAQLLYYSSMEESFSWPIISVPVSVNLLINPNLSLFIGGDLTFISDFKIFGGRNFNNPIFGLNFGGSYYLDSFIIYSRYNLGLSDLIVGGENTAVSRLSLGMGYLF